MNKNLKDLQTLTARNMKLYFRDKQSFFVSLITPLILIVLFVTFLKNVYEESMLSMVPRGVEFSDQFISAFSASWLISSILGVTCVTIAFCANTIMITDKVNNAINDIHIAPVNHLVISLSYFIANFLSTFIVCCLCLIFGLGFISFYGWYLEATDILMIMVIMILSISFGTLLASIVETFISSQGGASAIATLVSSMYGFICGAYMPISQFSSSIRTFVGLVPGTHGTILFRYYFMNGIMDKMEEKMPVEAVDALRKGFDNQLFLFSKQVTNPQMFLYLGISCIVLLGIYIIIVRKR